MPNVRSLASQKASNMETVKPAVEALASLPKTLRQARLEIDAVIAAAPAAIEAGMDPKRVRQHVRELRKMKRALIRLEADKQCLHVEVQDDMDDTSATFRATAGPVTRDLDGPG
jgi:hypothetical protein